MIECKKCKHLFRDRCDLFRHQSRIRPCIDENSQENFEDLPKNTVFAENNTGFAENNTWGAENNTGFAENNTWGAENNTFTEPNNTLENEDIVCHYCLHNFSRANNKKAHEKICKYKEDPVRILELELDIIPELPETKTECRFCTKTFCRVDILNRHIGHCKEREVYKQILTREKDKKNTPVVTQITNNNIQTQNNNTNTNCNNINTNCNNSNNLILNFGETNDTVKTEQIIQILRNVNKEFAPEQKYLMAGELVIRFDKLLTQTPENDNMVIPDSKCLYAEIKTPTGWEKISIDNSLNSCFKERASMLLERKEEINAFNDRVFQCKTNNEIFVETKQFAKRGLAHSYRGDDTRRIRTGLKINKLKKNK
jgi:hypothetical protein